MKIKEINKIIHNDQIAKKASEYNLKFLPIDYFESDISYPNDNLEYYVLSTQRAFDGGFKDDIVYLFRKLNDNDYLLIHKKGKITFKDEFLGLLYNKLNMNITSFVTIIILLLTYSSCKSNNNIKDYAFVIAILSSILLFNLVTFKKPKYNKVEEYSNECGVY